MHYDSSLRIWFDRDISFAFGEGLGADIVSLPRLVTSRSNKNLNEDNRITGKQSVKLTVLERVIDSIGSDTCSLISIWLFSSRACNTVTIRFLSEVALVGALWLEFANWRNFSRVHVFGWLTSSLASHLVP